MRTAIPAATVSTIPGVQANDLSLKKKAAPPKSGVGFFQMDCSLNLMSFNAEAAQVLGYPDNVEGLKKSNQLLAEEIRSRLVTRPSPGESVFATEFRSGRRRYFCRAFVIDPHGNNPSQPGIAVLLERGPSGLVSLAEVCQRFSLTQREQEVLAYLLQGMSSKEIANRMNVSPNTVKAFLRLIMIKTGTSSRSAIMGKVVMTAR